MISLNIICLRHFMKCTSQMTLSFRQLKKKTIKLKIIFFNEIVNDVTFKKVFHVFKLASTLLLILQIIKNENFVIFDEKKCFIKNKISKRTILHVFNCENQYSIDLMKNKIHIVNLIIVFYSNSKYNEKTIQLWHRRFDYLNRQNFFRLQNIIIDMNLKKVFKQT